MSFDLDALRVAVAAHGRVARVVVADVRGSAPRAPGAAMLIDARGQSGTIGGGALDFAAAEAARAMLARGVVAGGAGALVSRHALGPDLGQCCGGSVLLWSEVHDAESLAEMTGPVLAARGPGAMPMAVRHALAGARNGGAVRSGLIDGWMVEPFARPAHALWIWGAGHVGRALTQVLAPLPDLTITWIDVAADRFPESCPDRVAVVPAAAPAALIAHAPRHAHHLVLTYSHALDLELCHGLLSHGFASAGVIGSATKWARFRRRLADLGHGAQAIGRIDCPIGDPRLGKHPQQIALGVATALLSRCAAHDRPEHETTESRSA
ncbi:MAG: xanthine dehydrogenase accessory protein XdhC [Rhodobacteraceae bacterium]|nr:xanthine dehydrogenase accessory protein XdhC [Paracoccaceae bacterium]